MPREHSNTCDLVGFRQGYNAPAVCSCGADSDQAEALSVDRRERQQVERLFEAVVHCYEGDEHLIPEDLKEANFVRRARKFRAQQVDRREQRVLTQADLNRIEARTDELCEMVRIPPDRRERVIAPQLDTKDKDYGAALLPVDPLASLATTEALPVCTCRHDSGASSDCSIHDMPTVSEIKTVLDHFNGAVDREDVLEGTVRAAVCTAMLERVLMAMLTPEQRVQRLRG